MDTKTKIFWWTMGFLVFISFGLVAYRYLIKKDYIIQAQVDCDPYNEACFVWNCDPESDEEGEMCTGDPEEDTWYFKVINKNASQISSCDANDEGCEALICEENEPECDFTLCNEDNKSEMDSLECSDPITYSVENPIGEECEEGDEGCLESDDESSAEDGTEEEPMIQTTEDMISAQEETGEEVGNAAGVLPIEE
ncbi:MAG: hypothetical protein RBS77_01095 [Candidatus Moranbacteria bacterium]|jgi:hypothetical protein|nr:hypothetical protein [Candidatus Moranbacteria bacterium]